MVMVCPTVETQIIGLCAMSFELPSMVTYSSFFVFLSLKALYFFYALHPFLLWVILD